MNPEQDSRLERMLAGFLRLGVGGSSLSLAIGLVVALAGHPVWAGFLLHAGVLLLLATPVIRVTLSAASYAVRGDRLFAVLVTIVLLELLAGVFAAVQAFAGRT